jgi:hypothetical protein
VCGAPSTVRPRAWPENKLKVRVLYPVKLFDQRWRLAASPALCSSDQWFPEPAAVFIVLSFQVTKVLDGQYETAGLCLTTTGAGGLDRDGSPVAVARRLQRAQE